MNSQVHHHGRHHHSRRGRMQAVALGIVAVLAVGLIIGLFWLMNRPNLIEPR